MTLINLTFRTILSIIMISQLHVSSRTNYLSNRGKYPSLILHITSIYITVNEQIVTCIHNYSAFVLKMTLIINNISPSSCTLYNNIYPLQCCTREFLKTLFNKDLSCGCITWAMPRMRMWHHT